MTQDWNTIVLMALNGAGVNESEALMQIRVIEPMMEGYLKEQLNTVLEEERQFILNILDGIDIADKEMGVVGGTQAIRQALQSRIIN